MISTGTVFSLSTSNLTATDFKPAKSTSLADSDVSTAVAFFTSDFVP